MSDLYSTTDLEDNLSYLQETKRLIKSAIASKGQTVSDTDTFRSYADKIENIQSGGLNYTFHKFNTIDEMQAYPTPNNGDYGLVYENIMNLVNSSGRWNKIKLLDTVILPYTLKEEVHTSFGAIAYANSFTYDITKYYADLYYKDTKQSTITFSYTSSDGRTYHFKGTNNSSYNRDDFYNEANVYVNTFYEPLQYFLVINQSINFARSISIQQ